MESVTFALEPEASADPGAGRRWPARFAAREGGGVSGEGCRFANLKIIFKSNPIVRPERHGVNNEYHAQM
jgi:hypothetical protein